MVYKNFGPGEPVPKLFTCDPNSLNFGSIHNSDAEHKFKLTGRRLADGLLQHVEPHASLGAGR
jgi:hypothetical protein